VIHTYCGSVADDVDPGIGHAERLRHVDELMKTAQGYLDRTAPKASTRLPIAKLLLVRERPVMELPNERRCQARAIREDEWPAYIGASLFEISCSQVLGHEGPHQSIWHKEPFLKRWRVYEWASTKD
jgi:hypothetical protein